MHFPEGVRIRDRDLIGLTQKQEERILTEMVEKEYILGMVSTGDTEFWPPERSDINGHTRAHTTDV
jgi:hypothetical protein